MRCGVTVRNAIYDATKWVNSQTNILLIIDRFMFQVKIQSKVFQGFLNDTVGEGRLFHLTKKIILLSTFGEKMTEMFNDASCRQLSYMLFAIFFFHCSEYVLAITIHGKDSVSLKSLLISRNYVLALICSLVEYFVEIYFFPGLKEYWFISNTGLALVVVGEIIRKLAIITAGRSFTHLIKRYHEEHHVLITDGVYKYIRHPGYFGFFLWSVGTQIMLCNPLSTVVFTVVVWRFFRQRIPYEEFYLRQFFCLDYEEYAGRTISGVPFVK